MNVEFLVGPPPSELDGDFIAVVLTNVNGRFGVDVLISTVDEEGQLIDPIFGDDQGWPASEVSFYAPIASVFDAAYLASKGD